jgi:hypothetical protein
MAGWQWMRALLPTDAEHAFLVDPNGTLRLSEGKTLCRVGWGSVLDQHHISEPIPNTEGPEEASWIEACVEFPDREGRVFRCARPVSVYSLVMAAASSSQQPTRGDLRVVTDRAQGRFSRPDQQLLLCANSEGSCQPFAYRMEDSTATIAIAIEDLSGPYDRLVVMIQATDYLGIDRAPTPKVVYTTELAAVLVLLPTMVDEFQWYDKRLRSVFELTDRRGAPQPLVRYLAGETNAD